MLFRNKNGILVNICKNNYINDVLYYRDIMCCVCKNYQYSKNKDLNNNLHKELVDTIKNILYNKK